MFQTILKKENNPESIKENILRYNQTILPFYSTHGLSYTLQAKNAKISCRFFINQNAKSKILLVTGYKESYLKYAEVIYDLFHKGYSVFAYDHRGQGYSEKFPNQKNRGFLISFDDLVDDLTLFFNFVKNYSTNQKVFILAHSMGGAVTSLAVSQQKINPESIVLSSPMFGIVLSPFPILEYPLYLLSVFLCFLGFNKKYAFGQTDCFPLIKFQNNAVTHSMWRYQVWEKHIREIPEMQLGGPTFQWVRESVKASRKARLLCNKNVPTLLLQAENDTVVCNHQEDVFIKNCPHVQKKVIPYAKHETLHEVDFIREQVLNYIFDFFDNNS